MEMTPRERWMAVLNRQTPDRIPTDFWSTAEVRDRLKRELNCADDEALWRRLEIDRPRFVGPERRTDIEPPSTETDIWGVKHQRIDYGTGAYSEVAVNPLAHVTSVAEVHAHRWPSPDDYDYSSVTRQIEAGGDHRAVQAASFEPFLIYCAMRGMEQSYEDVLLEPEIADAILGHIFEFYHEYNRRIFEAGRGRIDITYVAEDLGGQSGPLFSLDVYRRFLLSNQRTMAELARQHGVHVMFHTDGAARIFLPDLIDEVGIEVLNPIQWRCPGMEREGLVRDFGDQIAFHGAMDNQYTLPFGTVCEVRDEVRDNLRIFADARWICAPCHNIQPVTPTCNIVALYETIHEAGVLT